ncbi:MAG TPA: bifunctional diaminohydroxyphosphoribosylaminopyrimidine deaminase/5-amino-6-(5-phosphoribosylamino)uracil reductase RibD [Polyangiaceae bacterium]|jgi:diaminohydroxyphosphoribosylaminopyrimidine deaminase/5-amino-6-(5-phosphoribosylamino)uracil reductase|nr:bifunctional diaminohydroxyphosphoribosylaminopyrimidine deaminase/5-amino-6-(5-phosphoribosylamino)uracil reductase RibD [Polyangiaceae bacterium]
MADTDAELMQRALDLGAQGDPSPNPHVGAVIVKNGQVIGEGFHAEVGGPHAEVTAISQAGDAAKGATLYVTLEPCAHQGRTGPCVEAIQNAGIRRVVIGCRDPNPNVVGHGVEWLREHDIEVELGILAEKAQALIAPWARYVTDQIAYLSVKMGVSLDGRTASRTGVSKWITGESARARVHSLRAGHDAVLVGINTILSDDPLLTVREVEGRNPIRCVVDSKLRLPLQSYLVTTAREIPTCVLTTEEASPGAEESLVNAGVSVIRVPSTPQGRCDVTLVLKALAAREVVSVLCEGGAELTGSLFAARLPSELHLFLAPVLLGPRGRPAAVDWAGPDGLNDAPRISPATWELCGTDAYVHGPVVYPKRKSTGATTE